MRFLSPLQPEIIILISAMYIAKLPRYRVFSSKSEFGRCPQLKPQSRSAL
jgi:hypothetical protein